MKGNCSVVVEMEADIPSTDVAVRARKLFYCVNHLSTEQGQLVVSPLDGSNPHIFWEEKVRLSYRQMINLK